jgi:hypothetical protein
MAIIDTVGDFQIGRVVSRTFGVLSRNAITFAIIGAVIMVPLLLVNFLAGSPNYIVIGTTKGWGLGAAMVLLQLMFPSLLQAALVQGTISDLNGQRPTLGQSLSAGFAVFVPVVLISIVNWLGIIFGMILLIVPGLMLMTVWAVVIPVRVVERTGFGDSFSRSGALSKGSRWKIFGLLLIYGVIAIVLGWLATAVTGVGIAKAGTMMNNTPYIVLEWIVRLVMSLLGAVGIAATYYELRTVKEGMAPQQLAAAFD